MEKIIPWDIGGGNLHLSYTGEGNGDIKIWSDTENFTGKTRSRLITLKTTKGSSKTLLLPVYQKSYRAYVTDENLVLTSAVAASVSNSILTIYDSDVYIEGDNLHI